jgi:hypothetical protein
MLSHPAPTSGSDAEAPIRRGASRTCLRPRDRCPLSLSTEPVDLNQVPLGQVPSLHHLRRSVVPIPSGLKVLCSMAFQVLWTCPTGRQRSCWDYGLRPSPAGLTAGLPASHCRALPAPAHGAYAHATGLRLRGVEPALALSHRSMLPSPASHQVGTPEG